MSSLSSNLSYPFLVPLWFPARPTPTTFPRRSPRCHEGPRLPSQSRRLVDPDAEQHAPRFYHRLADRLELLLHLDDTLNGLDDATKLGQHVVPGGIDELAWVRLDALVKTFRAASSAATVA